MLRRIDQPASETAAASEKQGGARTPCEFCAVRHVTFCSVLGAGGLSRMAAITHQAQFAPHQLLFQEGDAAHHAFNILEGTVKLYKSLPDGRTQITGFLFAGDFLGLSNTDHYSYAAEAITEVKVCQFARRDLEAVLDDYPRVVERLLTLATDELTAAQEQMLLLGRKTARERILSFLLSLSARARRRGQSGQCLTLSMSRADIADYLGLTIETVSRTMTKLRAQGILRLPRPQQIVLADDVDLSAIAGGSD